MPVSTLSGLKPGSMASTRWKLASSTPGADQQHQRERHLAGHQQRAARGAVPRPWRAAAALPRARSARGWRGAARGPGIRPTARRRASTSSDVKPTTRASRPMLARRAAADRSRRTARPAAPTSRGRGPARPADRRNQDRFGERSAATAARGWRRARGASPARASRAGRRTEHEVGDVDAADDQHEDHAAPQQVQRRSRVADEILLKATTSVRKPALIRISRQLRKAFEVRGVDGVDLALRLFDAWRPASRRPICCQLLLCRDSSDSLLRR